MTFLRILIKSIDAANDWVGRVLQYFLFAFFALLMAEVVKRYIFNAPTVWGNEMAQMFFAAYAILSGGYVLRTGGHVNVDILYARFSPKTRAAIDIGTSFLFFLFMGMMVWMGWELAWESMARFETSESAWNPPIWPLKMAIPLGALLLLLQGVCKLILDFFILFDLEPPVKYEVVEGDSL